jgi:hypothetical protein
MHKKDLITSLSHYNTFNFIHWNVCIQDGTVGYVLDTDPAYDRIVESWTLDYKEDDYVNFIMEVSADHFDMDDIMSFKEDFMDKLGDNETEDGTRIGFDGFDMWGQEYESYYLDDMLEQMIQIRLISQFAKDKFYRITLAMQEDLPNYKTPFDEHSEYILNRLGAWGRARFDLCQMNADRTFHTVTLGSHQSFTGESIEALNAMVDEYVSTHIGDGLAVDISYDTNSEGVLEATFEYQE